ncbi:ADP-dependent glucokinase/phosphofructokinase [Micromonospora auratinigra]|nr:ADP-dependent glucokinase/phosphofructokinase [Micromonospora auratinigra]
MTWEQCVREVTLASDPKRVAEVGDGWRGLAESLASLRQSLVGQQPYGPYVPGHEPTFSGGLSAMLGDWQGSGGDAYREHLQEVGKQIEELSNHASNVHRALTRIEGDIRKSIASIPVPLMDNFGWNEWSLPNGTELDPVGDGSDADGFLAMLRADYAQDPSAYDDRKFREKADDLEATMKIDGKADDHKRGGFWDTDSHLDNWYKDNTASANSGASPLPTAVQDERPRLLVPPPPGGVTQDGFEREHPKGGDFGGGGGGGIGGGGGGIGGGGVGSGFSPGGGGGLSGSGYHPPSTGSFHPSTGTSPHTGGSSFHPPSSTGTGFDSYPSSSDHDYGTGLAGAGSPSLGGGGGGYPGLGGGGGGLAGGLGGGGGGFGGGGGGVGSVGGIGGGGAGGAGLMGGVPGMVGGGNGKVPPMTSAGTALRNAAGAGGAGAGLRGAGGAGMMGGGMGGHGAGPGGAASEHSSWLTEDDDPWGTDSGAAPGILR